MGFRKSVRVAGFQSMGMKGFTDYKKKRMKGQSHRRGHGQWNGYKVYSQGLIGMVSP